MKYYIITFKNFRNVSDNTGSKNLVISPRSYSLLVPLLIGWVPGSVFNINNSIEMQTEHMENHYACGCSFLQLNSADEP